MFNLKRMLLISLLGLSFFALAEDPVPHQLYREAIDPNAPAAVTPTTSPAPAPASSATAPTPTPTPVTGTVTTKPGAVAPTTMPPSAMPSVPSAPAAMPSAPAMMPTNGKSAASNDSNFQQQIDLINQNNVLFAQTINGKIDSLNNQVAELQTRMQQLGQAMLLLNQEVRQKTAASSVSRSPASVFSNYTWFDYVFWLAIIVLVMILLSFFRRGSRAAAAPARQAPAVKPSPAAKPADAAPAAEAKKPAAEDLEGDYDYLGSSESIPAKLNLARAYVAMGNHADAKQVLKEVLELGDNKQRMEAEALLKKIPPA